MPLPFPRSRGCRVGGGREHLHAISPGNATTGGRVSTFRVGRDGTLTLVGSAPAAAGITGAAAS